MHPRARLDRIVRRHAAPLTIASVAALVMGLWWTVDAATTVERLETSSLAGRWVESGAFTYSVTVLRGSPAFPEGTVLGMGEPGYFTTVSPRVNLAFRWAVDDPASSRVAVAAAMDLVVSSESPSGRPYWTLRYPLANATFAGAGDDGVLLMGFFDFDRVLPEVENTTALLGAKNARVAWRVVSTVKVALESDLVAARSSSTFALPVDVDLPLYVLPGDDGAASVREHGEPERIVEERRAGVGAAIERPFLFVPTFLGVAGLALVARERLARPPARSAADREYEREIAKHEQWITPLAGAPAESARASPVIDVPSVEALVAIAAESQRRVLHDARERVLYVLAPEACYRCRKHARKPTSLTIVESRE